MFQVLLQPWEAALLSKTRNGTGGFQSLLSKLSRQREGLTQRFTDEDAERIVRYSMCYGSGGFEDRLRPLVFKVARIAGINIGYYLEATS